MRLVNSNGIIGRLS